MMCWLITEATLSNRPDRIGESLRLEHYDLGEQGSRIHLRLPRGFAPGELANIYFSAESAPAGWLGAWQKTSVVDHDSRVVGDALWRHRDHLQQTTD